MRNSEPEGHPRKSVDMTKFAPHGGRIDEIARTAFASSDLLFALSLLKRLTQAYAGPTAIFFNKLDTGRLKRLLQLKGSVRSSPQHSISCL